MSIQHVNAPDGKRHEPKGISIAAAGTVYVSNGSGSGAWTNQIAAVRNANLMPVYTSIPDVSTPGSYFVAAPLLGKIVAIYVTLDNAITIANSIVSAKINGVAVTGSPVTVTFAGSAAGSTYSSTPSGANTVAQGGSIEILTDGGSTTTARAAVTLVLDVT